MLIMIGAVIWLHGLGDRGKSFTFFPEKLNRKYDGDVRWELPDAPYASVTCNDGAKMTSWFDVEDIPVTKEAKDYPEDILASVERVEKIISGLMSVGVPSEKIVIGGFSQGGAMALQTILRSKHKLAGCICLSGWLMMRDEVKEWKTDMNNDTPIYWGHGGMDHVVDPETQSIGTEILTNLGFSVEKQTFLTLPHSLAPPEIDHVVDLISSWLDLDEK
eukprot:m.6948 g.6948  ORF g.6948 m.6948 type:complete len:218 (-) comp2677_c0_seq1:102-755(-)